MEVVYVKKLFVLCIAMLLMSSVVLARERLTISPVPVSETVSQTVDVSGPISGSTTAACPPQHHIDCRGDVDGDLKMSYADINPMRSVLNCPLFYMIFSPRMFWRADVNGDGWVDSQDIGPFVSQLNTLQPGECRQS
jgi:hypothetical protein